MSDQIDFQPLDQSSAGQIDFQPMAQTQPDNAGIADLSEKIEGVQNKVLPYAKQALTDPNIQPYKGINPFTKPTGNAFHQVLDSMRQAASLPLRYSASLGQASQPVAEATAETLGKAGVNPYVSGALAMSAGAAVDPRTWMPSGSTSFSRKAEGLSAEVAAKREARTGIPARNFQALHKDPGAIWAGRNVEQAGADIGAAKQAAGIDQGVTNDLSSLTPENIERINPTKAIKMDDINTVLSKVSAGEKATPQEAQNALDSINSILSQPSVQNNHDVFRQWTAVKSHINKVLGDVAPDVKAANANYAREKLGQAFSTMEAVNKNGKPSKLSMIANNIPAAAGGAIGGIVGGPTGALMGYEGGKKLSELYHAPFVAGLQTAAGSVISKRLNSLLSELEKMGTGPQGKALIARYLQQQGNQ